jgi:cytochrome oxidase Cu insertion factor (SCO1/SenC/PrrC family)
MPTARRALVKRAVITGVLLGVLVCVGLIGAIFADRRDAAAPSVTLDHLNDYGRVPHFVLTERTGRRITMDDLRGRVWVADFIYTECTDSCPTQSLQFAQLQREFAGSPDFRLVSITVDPAHDTPEVLGRYAERYGAGDRWWFLTGAKSDIYCLARDGFRLSVADARETAPVSCGLTSWLMPTVAWADHGSGGLIMHSARIVLVDREGRIRAYHMATESASMAELASNIRAVLAEAKGGV